MLLIALLALPLLAAAGAPLLVRVAGPRAGWMLALLPAGLAVALLAQLPAGQGPAPSLSLPWIPSLGLHLALRLDGLALLFALLVVGMGALVLVYGGGYLRTHARLGAFLGLLLLFMTGMLGIAVADNLFFLYVCWELTTITSWLLIGFEHEEEKARRAAWQALMTTAAGGLALLVGLVLLGQAAGTHRLSALLEQAPALARSPSTAPALLLVVAGAAVKSALVPLHAWLPNAMAAPTPVSAYLHSAAMVKAGVFVLARFSPLLAAHDLWRPLVTGLGALTAVVGAVLALGQTDVKRLLAYTTISALGMIALPLGLHGAEAARAAVLLLFAHGLYKGALFMVAGALDHGTGTRDLREVSGLRRAMPRTTAAAWLAAASMVGLPPTLGYLAEEELVGAAHGAHGAAGTLALAAALLAGTLYTAAGFVVGLRPFVGRPRAPQPPHEVAPALWLPPLLLGGAGLLLGLVPGALQRGLLAPAAAGVSGGTPHAALALWHGLTPAFVLGTAMLLAGGALALAWGRLLEAARRAAVLARYGPDRAYELAVRALDACARRLDRLLQHGYLPGYLSVVLLTLLLLVLPPVLAAGVPAPPRGEMRWGQDGLVALVVLAGTAGALLRRGRVAVLVSMNLVGFGVAIVYALSSAPDLALTQLLVEVVLTVALVLILPLLPRFERLGRPFARVRDGLLCAGTGALVTMLLLLARAGGHDARVATFYRDEARRSDSGNVVNKILVDFRALDTLGEVTVLSAAALSVLTLLVGRTQPPSTRAVQGQSLILGLAAQALLPLLLLFAVYLLLSGHHQPGGGFAAALVLASTLALFLLARPRARRLELMRLRPTGLFVGGVSAMIASGLPALVTGQPFLTALQFPHELPLLGGLSVGTPLLFDAGVAATAGGAILLLLQTLEEHGPWTP